MHKLEHALIKLNILVGGELTECFFAVSSFKLTQIEKERQMREKMVTERGARVAAHSCHSNIGPIKREAHRHFRRVADCELKKVVASGDYDLAGPHLGNRLTAWDVD